MANPNAVTPKLDQTGLSQVWSLIVSQFVAKNVLTDELITKLKNVDTGAQVNALEHVFVNGEELTITNKGVSITIPTGALAGKDKVGNADLDDSLAAVVTKVSQIAEKAQVNVLEGLTIGGADATIDENKKIALGSLAGKSSVAEADLATALADKINAAQTSEQVQGAINTALSNVYKYKGSVAAIADLPDGTEEHPRANGDMYNITAEFTTDATFNDPNKKMPAGTNVAWNGEKWDCMAGTYDFSEFVERSELTAIGTETIAEICVVPNPSAGGGGTE